MKKYKSKTVIRLAFVLKFLRLEILITVQKLLWNGESIHWLQVIKSDSFSRLACSSFQSLGQAERMSLALNDDLQHLLWLKQHLPDSQLAQIHWKSNCTFLWSATAPFLCLTSQQTFAVFLDALRSKEVHSQSLLLLSRLFLLKQNFLKWAIPIFPFLVTKSFRISLYLLDLAKSLNLTGFFLVTPWYHHLFRCGYEIERWDNHGSTFLVIVPMYSNYQLPHSRS